jgi:hypothetical protein
MLVHRWAILQTDMPCGISIQRTIALVKALAKLHNFCIEQNEMNSVESSIDNRFRIKNNELGFVPLEEANNCDFAVLVQLLAFCFVPFLLCSFPTNHCPSPKEL